MNEIYVGCTIAAFGALLGTCGWILAKIWQELVDTHDTLRDHKVILSNVNGDVIQVKDDMANMKIELAKKPCHMEIDEKLAALRIQMDEDTAILIKECKPQGT